jgi:type I restriction-modification system DNA methylase subunit
MAKNNITEIGFEKEIWKAADLLRGNLDASEYKSVVLGLIFLKYISDRFEARYQYLSTWKMAHMNLAIRGIEADLGKFNADTFFDDQHPALKADLNFTAGILNTTPTKVSVHRL